MLGHNQTPLFFEPFLGHTLHLLKFIFCAIFDQQQSIFFHFWVTSTILKSFFYYFWVSLYHFWNIFELAWTNLNHYLNISDHFWPLWNFWTIFRPFFDKRCQFSTVFKLLLKHFLLTVLFCYKTQKKPQNLKYKVNPSLNCEESMVEKVEERLKEISGNIYFDLSVFSLCQSLHWLSKTSPQPYHFSTSINLVITNVHIHHHSAHHQHSQQNIQLHIL